MDSFVLCVGVPAVVCVRQAAVVDEAYRRVYATHRRAGPARQRVCSDDAGKSKPPKVVVVQGKELSLVLPGQGLQLCRHNELQ